MYEQTLERERRRARSPWSRRATSSLLHDPQTGRAGTAARGGPARIVVWRCHVGCRRAERVDEAVVGLPPAVPRGGRRRTSSRASDFAPAWAGAARTARRFRPRSTRSRRRTSRCPRAMSAACPALRRRCSTATARRRRAVRSPGRVAGPDQPARRPRADGPPAPVDVPLVVQASRWDWMKDMAGVMEGFADHVDAATGAHLVLAGPAVDRRRRRPRGGRGATRTASAAGARCRTPRAAGFTSPACR